MGYFNLNMLNMAMDLAFEDQTYEDMAVKFFEHYIRSVEAINKTDGKLFTLDIIVHFQNFIM